MDRRELVAAALTRDMTCFLQKFLCISIAGLISIGSSIVHGEAEEWVTQSLLEAPFSPPQRPEDFLTEANLHAALGEASAKMPLFCSGSPLPSPLLERPAVTGEIYILVTWLTRNKQMPAGNVLLDWLRSEDLLVRWFAYAGLREILGWEDFGRCGFFPFASPDENEEEHQKIRLLLQIKQG